MTTIVVRPTQNQVKVRPVEKLSNVRPARYPRIASVSSARPSFDIDQRAAMETLRVALLGPDWMGRPEAADMAGKAERLFAASGVRQRQSVIDFQEFYSRPRSTGERMAEYAKLSYPLGRAAVESCLQGLSEASDKQSLDNISDFIVTSCTGYSAPGLDIQLARDLGMRSDVRRVIVGHMGCLAGVVGLRQSLAAVRAHPGASVIQLSIELTSLHFALSPDLDTLTGMSLFGDAAAALLLTDDPSASGPEVVSVYCDADFAAADQLSWRITDTGFVMGLSPRVPVTLRRTVGGAVEKLLAPHGLSVGDITHWMVHPGGPSILDAVQKKLELSDEQMDDSRQVLAEHGNCSSATILLILERLVRSGRAKPGEWGVMMAFGPGLTIEMCLLRF